MCTVSFVATKDSFVLTSNRDEQTIRATHPPERYIFENQHLYFPKDPYSGGTWFAVNENGNVLILLNGAIEKHIPLPPYNRSRGIVVLEIISDTNPSNFWNKISLENVEPFTLVLFQNLKLYQLRWDGSQKSVVELDIAHKHIWSSATLYPKEIQVERAKWFYEFVDAKPEISDRDLLQFHQNTHTENTQNGLIINRNDVLKTLSITQVVVHKNDIEIIHKDLIDNTLHHNLMTVKR